MEDKIELNKPRRMKAYITLLSNEKYFDGVVILYRTLLKLQSQYPLYCMLSITIDNDVESRLEKIGVKCIRLSRKTIGADINAESGSLTFSHWAQTFDKLQVWGLTQFEKLVFVDSDMLIRSNIDSLFERPPFTAVCAGCSYPTNTDWFGLNSGLLVLEPNKKIEEDLYALAPKVVEEFLAKGMSVGDQDVINRYMSDWHLHKELHLDEGYNLFADYLSYYIKYNGYSWSGEKGSPVYIVHFIGCQKPWMKKQLRNWAWFFRECIRNPYYFLAYIKYISYLRR